MMACLDFLIIIPAIIIIIIIHTSIHNKYLLFRVRTPVRAEFLHIFFL